MPEALPLARRQRQERREVARSAGARWAHNLKESVRNAAELPLSSALGAAVTVAGALGHGVLPLRQFCLMCAEWHLVRAQALPPPLPGAAVRLHAAGWSHARVPKRSQVGTCGRVRFRAVDPVNSVESFQNGTPGVLTTLHLTFTITPKGPLRSVAAHQGISLTLHGVWMTSLCARRYARMSSHRRST